MWVLFSQGGWGRAPCRTHLTSRRGRQRFMDNWTPCNTGLLGHQKCRQQLTFIRVKYTRTAHQNSSSGQEQETWSWPRRRGLLGYEIRNPEMKETLEHHEGLLKSWFKSMQTLYLPQASVSSPRSEVFSVFFQLHLFANVYDALVWRSWAQICLCWCHH